jgi:hypothetical protein
VESNAAVVRVLQTLIDKNPSTMKDARSAVANHQPSADVKEFYASNILTTLLTLTPEDLFQLLEGLEKRHDEHQATKKKGARH